MWTFKAAHQKTGVETIQLKVMITREMNHHDGANMSRNQSIKTQNIFLSFEPRPYEQ
jgi:hypothetical protein